MNADWMRTIVEVAAGDDDELALRWSDGTEASIRIDRATRAAIGDATQFAQVSLGDWGHGVVWPGGTELGADSLWAETLTATGRGDARAFLEWRRAHGMSLARAAEALGLSRRTVAYYSNGERPVPKAIQLACKGWDALHGKRKAA